MLSRAGAALLLVVALALGGCAAPLPRLQRPVSTSLPARADSPQVQLSADVPAGRSGFWPLAQAAYALDARLALLRTARHTLDLQYYLLADDGVGRNVMRELRDAAARGVRVRLLVDDLYTQAIEPRLQALQTYPNVEVRVFNPFTFGRGTVTGRLLNFIGDFTRLNHRMHNKLLVADGALAIIGGRNLADEYFLRGRDSNFIDMDLLVAGALLPPLGALFDSYWNSAQAYPLEALDPPGVPQAQLQQAFDAWVGAAAPIDALTDDDVTGQPPLSRALALGRQRFVVADALAMADPPSKVRGAGEPPLPFEDTVTARFVEQMQRARSEIMIFSPYFIPGRKGMERLREARAAGVEVRVVTNAIGTSDEPLVNEGYRSYREQMLGIGVQLYELSALRTSRDPVLKRLLGRSRGQLHAKMAFVDRKRVIVGSMNVDLRSAYTNTEVAVTVDSAELAQLILQAYRADSFGGLYEVQLRPDGQGLQWVGRDADGAQVLDDEPEIAWWQRLKLWFQFLFVPEDLL